MSAQTYRDLMPRQSIPKVTLLVSIPLYSEGTQEGACNTEYNMTVTSRLAWILSPFYTTLANIPCVKMRHHVNNTRRYSIYRSKERCRLRQIEATV